MELADLEAYCTAPVQYTASTVTDIEMPESPQSRARRLSAESSKRHRFKLKESRQHARERKWHELPSEQQAAVRLFGFTPNAWNYRRSESLAMDTARDAWWAPWSRLTLVQRDAARKLGYEQELWEAEVCDSAGSRRWDDEYLEEQLSSGGLDLAPYEEFSLRTWTGRFMRGPDPFETRSEYSYFENLDPELPELVKPEDDRWCDCESARTAHDCTCLLRPPRNWRDALAAGLTPRSCLGAWHRPSNRLDLGRYACREPWL